MAKGDMLPNGFIEGISWGDPNGKQIRFPGGPFLSQATIDAGKRASDAINMHITFGSWDEIRTKFMAIRMSDGGSDGVLYDSKQDAIRHQFHEQQCIYFAFRNMPNGTTPSDMAEFIMFHASAYQRGMRLVDPDQQFAAQDLIMTAGQTDYLRGRRRSTMS